MTQSEFRYRLFAGTPSIALTSGSWVTLTCTYDGTAISITDGANTDAAALTGSLAINSESVHVGELTAKLDSVKIGDTSIDTPTWKLNLEFEPDEVSTTTITDLSASGNDVTYSLAAMDADIVVTIGELTPILFATYGSGSSYPSGFALMPDGLVEPAGWHTDGDYTSLPGSQIIADIFGESDLPLNMFWLTLIGALAIFGGFWIYDKTRHLFGMTIAVMMVFCFFAGVAMLDWWIVMVYAIVATGVLIKEQTYGY
ncbi:MAG: hypothetical protein PHV74_12930 [Dehalococcoidia bacterium]|nr:hypothetical protein [Dehalococcoidia bacterium]